MTQDQVTLDEYKPYIADELIERGHARRMGHLENYFALLQRQKLYTNFSIYGELNKEVKDVDLTRALRSIIFKNPILAHTIVPKKYPDQEPFYQSEEYLNAPYPEHDFIKVLPKLSLSDILINEQEEFREIVDDILTQFKEANGVITPDIMKAVAYVIIPICDPSRPNWRLFRLSPTKFFYISNHCTSDAISGVNIFQDICTELSQNDEEPFRDDLQIFNYEEDWESFHKIYIPITDIIEYRPALTSLPKIIASALVKGFLNYRNWPTELTSTNDKGIPFDFNIITFTNDEVNSIRETVKKYNCTFTPFLQASLLVRSHVQ